MAVIYEHWRPDINECFYVGASRDGEDTRPYYYGPHNDDYDAIVASLAEKGMKPFTNIIWQNLERDCVGAYEKMRIMYRRALVGDRLTNIADGGDGFNFDWDDELCARQRDIMKEFYATEEGQKCIKLKSKKQQISLHKFLSDEGDAWKELQRQIKADFLSSEDGQKWREEQSKRISDFFLTEDGKKRAEQHSQWMQAHFRTEDGKKQAQNHSMAIKLMWQTPEYKHRMGLRDWHRSNVKTQYYWGS